VKRRGEGEGEYDHHPETHRDVEKATGSGKGAAPAVIIVENLENWGPHPVGSAGDSEGIERTYLRSPQ
jgi:hypothetical protein